MNYLTDLQDSIGVVIIGRNEGNRLICSIKSVIDECRHVVYVDSGSTDNSVKSASELGVDVVKLDMDSPFTAARARNAGFEHIYQHNPEIVYVQFVDGDCEMMNGWFQSAVQTLENNLNAGIVCGRLKERYPEYSVFNQLCDIEWNTPVGDVKSCGGIFMVRSSLFAEVDGFNALLIAGEEPELCLRIRMKGWSIQHIKEVMSLHDANITHFSQWWLRNVRGGYFFAEGAYMYGKGSEHYCVAESISIWFWGGILPIIILILSFISSLFMFLLLLYPIQMFRIFFKLIPKNWIRFQYSFFLMLGKFPEIQGQIKFIITKMLKSTSRIIEYK